MRMKKKEPSVFWQEQKRDFQTFKRLHGKERLQFVFDYYKWKITAAVVLIVIVCMIGHMVWEGQRPCRLRVCVVLNTEDDCSLWFHNFEKKLKSDKKPGALDVNQDQPFDYDNMYYYVQEMEVMTTVSSGRMDVAICGEDMYSYLLALNACLPLDEALSADLIDQLQNSGQLVQSTAGLQEDENGNVDLSQGTDGYFAIELSDTEFGQTYNQPTEEDGESPLYAVIISNTDHLEDSVSLIHALLEEN